MVDVEQIVGHAWCVYPGVARRPYRQPQRACMLESVQPLTNRGQAWTPRPFPSRTGRRSTPASMQLTRDLADAIEQRTATSEVLECDRPVGHRSLGPVFETVVRHAVSLCRADCGYVYQLDGDVYRIAFIVGGSQEYREYMQRHPVKQGPETLVGRVALERRIVQIPDVTADPTYRWPTGRELGGYRTMLGAPMLVGDGVVGVLILWRLEVDPFDEQTIELVTTFAAQGSIALRNVELFQQLEQRSAQLARSVDELRVLGEISQAVSSTLDLGQVLGSPRLPPTHCRSN